MQALVQQLNNVMSPGWPPYVSLDFSLMVTKQLPQLQSLHPYTMLAGRRQGSVGEQIICL